MTYWTFKYNVSNETCKCMTCSGFHFGPLLIESLRMHRAVSSSGFYNWWIASMAGNVSIKKSLKSSSSLSSPLLSFNKVMSSSSSDDKMAAAAARTESVEAKISILIEISSSSSSLHGTVVSSSTSEIFAAGRKY